MCLIDGNGLLRSVHKFTYIFLTNLLNFLCKIWVRVFFIMGYCNFKMLQDAEHVAILDTDFFL
jgi:hypothetical protein